VGAVVLLIGLLNARMTLGCRGQRGHRQRNKQTCLIVKGGPGVRGEVCSRDRPAVKSLAMGKSCRIYEGWMEVWVHRAVN
jgi:hypothetical protein